VRRIPVRVDVTDAVGTGERLEVAATVVVGDTAPPTDPLVYVALPGGGYSRHYYDLDPPGYEGYSQAAFHAAAGDVFVAVDHLAVGDSDIPAKSLDFDAVGRSASASAREIVRRLRTGALDGSLGPVQPAAVVGLGQSYGGFVLTIAQALDPVFDGVAMLGWSGIQTLPPWPDDVDITAVMSGEAGDGLDHPMRPWFHHRSEPDDLVLMDMTRPAGAVGAAQPWGAAYAPGGPNASGRNPLEPGVVGAEAAAIEVPVMVACGEIDVVGDPRAEPTAYRASPDVTVTVFPRMAHMHNFAPTRTALWRRLRSWGAAVADGREG
jgi:hypothetical protein